MKWEGKEGPGVHSRRERNTSLLQHFPFGGPQGCRLCELQPNQWDPRNGNEYYGRDICLP